MIVGNFPRCGFFTVSMFSLLMFRACGKDLLPKRDVSMFATPKTLHPIRIWVDKSICIFFIYYITVKICSHFCIQQQRVEGATNVPTSTPTNFYNTLNWLIIVVETHQELRNPGLSWIG